MLSRLWIPFIVAACVASAAAEEATDVAVAEAHACALYDNGDVYCWGDLPGDFPSIPFTAWKVEGLPPANSIASGRFGACAVDKKGGLWCWGTDLQRSMRELEHVVSRKPFRVEGLPPVSTVALGFVHQCAIAANGGVWCWGENPCGEVGCGDKDPRNEPTLVPYVGNAVSVSAGVNNTCIVMNDGQLSCWGSDNPTMPDQTPFVYDSPEPLIFSRDTIGELRHVANGRNFACGLRRDGKITCWGSNIMGQIGTASPRVGFELVGIGEVEGIDSATDLDASYFKACAIQAGDAYCWGNLEAGDWISQTDPVSILRLGSATRIGVGEPFSCAIVDSRVLCWGLEGVDDVAVIPGMRPENAVPVPGLPGETPAGSIVQRLLTVPDDVRELIEERQFETAINIVRKLRQQGPDTSVLKDLEIQAYFEFGLTAKKAGSDDDAYAYYSKAIELSDNGHAPALNNRAIIQAARGNLDQALADIDAAIALNPSNSLFHANRCLYLRLDGQLESALEECETAVSLGLPGSVENSIWVLLQRGLVRRMLGNLEGAIADLDIAIMAAKPETVTRIQEMMRAAALYTGPIDGIPNPELGTAVANCIRSDACFERASRQLSDVVDFLE